MYYQEGHLKIMKKFILFIMLPFFLLGCGNENPRTEESLSLDFTEDATISFYHEEPVEFSYFESEGIFEESDYSTIVLLGEFSHSTINDIIKKTDDFEENFNFVVIDEAKADSLLDVINTFRSTAIEMTDNKFYLITDEANEEVFKEIHLINDVVFANHLVVSDSEINLNEKITELLDRKRALLFDTVIRTENYEASDPDAYHAIDHDYDTKWSNTSGEDQEIIFTFDKRQNFFRYRILSSEAIQSFAVELYEDGKWVSVEEFENYDSKIIDRYIAMKTSDKIKFTFKDETLSIERLQLFNEYELANELEYKNFSYKEIDMPYRIYIPEAIDEYDEIPLVLALHGSGQRGKDNRQTLATTKSESGLVFTFPETQEKHPSIVVFPQSGEHTLWRDEDLMEATFALLEHLKSEYPSIDGDRIYATGMSTGAEGAANMAIVQPDYFAGLILVGGGPNNPVGGAEFVIDTVVPNVDKIADIPTWFVQAHDDSIRSIDLTNQMVNGYRALGYNPKYMVYLPDVVGNVANSSHSCWVLSYKEDRMIDWLFEQNRNNRLEQGSELSPIPEMTDEEVLSLPNDGLNYIDFDTYFKE